jgi:hypothetical protein
VYANIIFLDLYFVFMCSMYIYWSWGSPVSIVTDYELDDGFLSASGEEKDFSSSLSVQTGSGAHPASYPMGMGGPFPGGKMWVGRDADHSPPSSVEVKNK